MTSPTLERGEVVLTRFPFTDLTGASLRQAVVVSKGQIGADIVLAAISSVVRGRLAPTDCTVQIGHPEFALTGLRDQGLKKNAYGKTFLIEGLRSRISPVIGRRDSI